MNTKSIRARLVQMEVRPGRPSDNTARMIEYIRSAQTDNVDLIVFPEMAIPGYLIGDEWEHEAFLRECEACAADVRAAATRSVVVFGSVGIDWDRRNEDGRVRKYNALFAAEGGLFVGPLGGPYPFVIKTLQPNYREFDDSRHFFGLRQLSIERGSSVDALMGPVKTRNFSLGCVICEDAWDTDYNVSPLNILATKEVDLFVNISCSPFTVNKNAKRNRVFSAQAAHLKRPLLYVNNIGIQNNGKTVFTFDGSSCIYDSHRNQIAAEPSFCEATLTHDIPLDGSAFGQPVLARDDGMADIYAAILYGTRKFMEMCGVDRVTIGVSGGIDSSVVAALYARLLPPENLLLVNMPSRFNSPTTRSLARTLADNLDCYYAEVPIEQSMELTRRQVDNLTIANTRGRLSRALELSDLIRENIQARDRSARVLAAISAAFGGVFTCNANKSEATVGYSTLYGDLAGYFANIADLWKGDVYRLAQYLNEAVYGRPVIPRGSMDVTPSAELSEAQNVDEGKGDPLVYPYHDALFRSWVEWWDRTTPEEILTWYMDGTLEQKLGYDGTLTRLFPNHQAFVSDLERWWTQYQGMGLAKRVQAPPILAVKRRAFGFDHRESQMGARYTRKYREMKSLLLASSSSAL